MEEQEKLQKKNCKEELQKKNLQKSVRNKAKSPRRFL
jgi:hypothetical protein